jgi:hypothetical protein
LTNEPSFARQNFALQRLRRNYDRAIIASAASDGSLNYAMPMIPSTIASARLPPRRNARAMPVREQTPKVSTKLKVVKELRRHLLLSPEEYRLLVAHIVRDHLAAQRRAPGRRRERKVA